MDISEIVVILRAIQAKSIEMIHIPVYKRQTKKGIIMKEAITTGSDL